MSQYHTPSAFVASYPLSSEGPVVPPPVCLTTHWDPTEMIRRILPAQRVGLPQDPRPWVRVCKSYVTSGPEGGGGAPMPPSSLVFPSGGQFYPPGRYAQSIDAESVLRTLTQPLDKWCPTAQYIPDEDSTMYRAGSTVPDRQPVSSAFIQELAMPQALLRTGEKTCRSENDEHYMTRSSRLFNNPTKQDRYGADKYYALPDRHHEKGEPMARGGVPLPVTVTGQAGRGRWQIPLPGSSTSPNRLGTAQRQGAHTSVVGVATSGLAAPVW